MVEAVKMLKLANWRWALLSGCICIFDSTKQNLWNSLEKSHRTAHLEPLRDMAKQAVASGLLWLKTFCGSVWPKNSKMYSLIYWLCVHWELMLNQSNKEHVGTTQTLCQSTIYRIESLRRLLLAFMAISGCFNVLSSKNRHGNMREREWRYYSQQGAPNNIPNFRTYTKILCTLPVSSVNNSGVSCLTGSVFIGVLLWDKIDVH